MKWLALVLLLSGCGKECGCNRLNAPCHEYGFKAAHDAKCVPK